MPISHQPSKCCFCSSKAVESHGLRPAHAPSATANSTICMAFSTLRAGLACAALLLLVTTSLSAKCVSSADCLSCVPCVADFCEPMSRSCIHMGPATCDEAPLRGDDPVARYIAPPRRSRSVLRPSRHHCGGRAYFPRHSPASSSTPPLPRRRSGGTTSRVRTRGSNRGLQGFRYGLPPAHDFNLRKGKGPPHKIFHPAAAQKLLCYSAIPDS